MSPIFRRNFTGWSGFCCVTIKSGLIGIPKLKKKSQRCFNDSQPHLKNFDSVRFFMCQPGGAKHHLSLFKMPGTTKIY
jgi:hypothetical protein